MKARSYAFLSLAMSIAGSAVVAGKYMVGTIPVFLAAELGILAGLVFLLPLARAKAPGRTRLTAAQHLLLAAQALCGIVLYRVFLFWGLQHTTASTAGLIGSAAPACIVLLAFVLLKEKPGHANIAGIVCVSLGLVALNVQPFMQVLHGGTGGGVTAAMLKGNALVLGAVLCEALFSVMSKAGCANMPPLERTAILALYAFIWLLPLAGMDLARHGFQPDIPSLLCIAYYGVFVSFLSYLFWFKGIAGVPAGVAAPFTALVPVSSLVLSRVLLGEHIGLAHWMGFAFVMAGIVLSCLP